MNIAQSQMHILYYMYIYSGSPTLARSMYRVIPDTGIVVTCWDFSFTNPKAQEFGQHPKGFCA